MASGIEFDWDEENKRHLAAHKVLPVEFEQVLSSGPLDLGYEMANGEERYRSIGLTTAGRLLTVVWTIRSGKVRAVTAFRAGAADKKAFLEKFK